MSNLDLYEAIRPSIKTGDMVAWHSDSLFPGRIIQWFSKSEFSHISIAVRFAEFDQDRVYIFEEVETGAVLMPLSKRLQGQNGKAWIFPLAADLLPIRSFMGAWCLSKLGTHYDYKGLLENIGGRISVDAHAMICSEYGWMAFGYGCTQAHCGLNLLRRATDKLKGKVPRPSDWPMLQKCGIFGKEEKIL